MNVLICDDHWISVLGIEQVMRTRFPDQSWTFRTCTLGEEALKESSKSAFDLLIIDEKLPDTTGLEVAQKIRKTTPQCFLILLTSADHPKIFQTAVRLGFNAIIRKSKTEENLVSAIQSILKNSNTPFLDSEVQTIIRQDDSMPLSERELQVTRLIIDGLTSPEIAEKLGCSLSTIKTYRTRVFNKSGARNSSELVAWFLKQGNPNSHYGALS